MSEEVTKQAPAVEAEAAKGKSKGKKGKRVVQSGQVHIQATFNNTIISVSDKKGEVLSSSSAGANGFRGSKMELLTPLKSLPKKLSKSPRKTTVSLL